MCCFVAASWTCAPPKCVTYLGSGTVCPSGTKRPPRGQFRLGLIILLATNILVAPRHIYSQASDIRKSCRLLRSETSALFLCSSRNSTPFRFYASKDLNANQNTRTAHEIVWKPQPATARDECGEDKQPMPPISLLPVIGGSIATAIAFEILRVRHAAKMGLPRTQLSWSQNILASLPSLLLGLGVAIFLSAPEVSLRYHFRGGV